MTASAERTTPAVVLQVAAPPRLWHSLVHHSRRHEAPSLDTLLARGINRCVHHKSLGVGARAFADAQAAWLIHANGETEVRALPVPRDLFIAAVDLAQSYQQTPDYVVACCLAQAMTGARRTR